MRATLFVLLFPALCFASDWRSLPGEDIKYDAASLTRDGDNVTAWVRNGAYDKGYPVEVTINCARRTSTEGGRVIKITPDSTAEKALKALCKRAWEVWK